MYPFERLNKVVGLLKEKGQIRVGDDAKVLGVSYSTLHRDLDVLEQQGVVEKVRGGAVLTEKQDVSSHFTKRLSQQNKEKTVIAKKTAELIKDDTCIFIDHSTTSIYLARELAQKGFLNLVILTNSLFLSREFAGTTGIKVMLTGGEASHELGAISGNWVLKFFKFINVHQIFLSVGALSPDKGFMTQLPFINEIFPEMFQLDIPVIVMADSSKFHKVCTFHISDIESAQTIVTNNAIPADIAKAIKEKGIELIT